LKKTVATWIYFQVCSMFTWVDVCSTQLLNEYVMLCYELSRCVAVYSRHFVASRINAPAVVVAAVFTLDHFVTTQTTMAWTKSLLDPTKPSVFDGQFLLGRLRASYCLLRTSHSPRSYCQCRGGFRHVQHVQPNRGPTKSGPHKRTKISFLIFLQHGNKPEILKYD